MVDDIKNKNYDRDESEKKTHKNDMLNIDDGNKSDGVGEKIVIETATRRTGTVELD